MKRIILMLFVVAMVSGAYAVTDCSFTTIGSTDYLDSSCTTDETIFVPNGSTLNGQGFTITAVDPNASHFKGAVIQNAGNVAHVTNVVVTTDSLANVCDGGDDRLRGIMLESASGSIIGNNVMNMNQGLSGCQEGNGIEVRNAPFDNTHPNTQEVVIQNNQVTAWQKGGIIANGDLDVTIRGNKVSSSNSDLYSLAGNSIQVAYGATGQITNNIAGGNQWCGASSYVATGFLLYYSENLLVQNNVINGIADIGIYELGTNTTLINNKVFEDKHGEDCGYLGYDLGIGAWGDNVQASNNKVKGYDDSYDGIVGGKNKVVSGPNGPNTNSTYW